MKNWIKIVVLLTLCGIIIFQVISFAFKEDARDKIISQNEIYSLQRQAKLSAILSSSDEGQLYDKLTAIYESKIKDATSTKKEIKYAKEHLAELKVHTGDEETALQLATEVLTEWPKSFLASAVIVQVHRQRAGAYIKERKYDEALWEYQKILDYPLTEKWQAFSENIIAHYYVTRFDFSNAKAAYQDLIAKHPYLPRWKAKAHYSIAEIYLIEQDQINAEAELQNLIQGYPNTDWAKAARKELNGLTK